MSDQVPSGEQTQSGDQTPAPTPTPGFTPPQSQAELDQMMAKNRRGVQARLTEAEKKAAAYDALQAKVNGFLENEGGEGFEDLDHFREATEAVIKTTRSEADQAKRDNAVMEQKLSKAQKAAEESRSNFANAMIQRQIADDAADMVVDGAGREGAVEYFQLKLSQLAEFNHETHEVGIKWKVTDEAGNTSEQIVPVKQALKDMEANPSKYGRYFRSTVNGGAGGETIDGVKRTPDGGVDFANMDFAKFQELASKNPQLMRDAANKLEF